jgi:peroxiredoxin
MRVVRAFASAALVLASLSRVEASDDRAPDVALVSASGEPVRLSNWMGKRPVVLLFMRGFTGDFACFFCSAQTNDYEAQYEKLRNTGAEVLMILPGVKGPEGAAGYVKAVGSKALAFPLLLDPDLSACRAFGVAATNRGDGVFPVDEPATIVVAKDGTILFAHHGANPSDRPSVETVLDVLAGKKPVAAPTTPAAPAASLPSLEWVPFDEGTKAARSAKKPILLEFFADW